MCEPSQHTGVVAIDWVPQNRGTGDGHLAGVTTRPDITPCHNAEWIGATVKNLTSPLLASMPVTVVPLGGASSQLVRWLKGHTGWGVESAGETGKGTHSVEPHVNWRGGEMDTQG